MAAAYMQNPLGQNDLLGAALAANSTLPMIIMNIGETFIPGLGLANRVASSYFQIDLSYHIVIAFGALAIFTGLSYLLSKAWAWVSPYVVSTAEVRYDDEMYNYLMYWVSKQNFSTKTTTFVAGVRTNSVYVWTGEDSDDKMEHENEDEAEGLQNRVKNWDKMKTVNYTPAKGRHVFWYRGRPFSFGRYPSERQSFWSSSEMETIYISTLGRNTGVIKELLTEAQIMFHERDGGKTVIYRGTRPSGAGAEDLEWTRCLSRPPRPMSTVVLDEVQKNMIIDDMREYLHSYTRKWYSNRGLPYRRGYLFHGPPGTGKTSLCFALAGLLNLRIYVVSLNSKSVSEDSLAKLFSSLPWRCIILLEDIDSAGITAKRSEAKEVEDSETKTETKTDSAKAAAADAADPGGANSTNPRGITLSAFLNIIDGVASSEGRVLVMTTNHIEKLDPAILRPGRVDVTIRFQFANHEMTKGIFQAIYRKAEGELIKKTETQPGKQQANGSAKSPLAITASDEKNPSNETKRSTRPIFKQHNKTDEEIEVLANEFADQMPLDEFTPAEIQGFLLRHKQTPEDAVKGVAKFIETLRAEKEVQKKGIA